MELVNPFAETRGHSEVIGLKLFNFSKSSPTTQAAAQSPEETPVGEVYHKSGEEGQRAGEESQHEKRGLIAIR